MNSALDNDELIIEFLKASIEEGNDVFLEALSTVERAKEKRISFKISVEPFYSEKNINALKDSILEMEQGKTITKTMNELKSMEK